MAKDKAVVGFIGAGGIARSHAFSLNSLKYYFNDAPAIELAAVCSSSSKSRDKFAGKYGFEKACDLKDFLADKHVDTVFILGPNKVHFEHFRAALSMSSIKRIYLEKPVCSNTVEEEGMRQLAAGHSDVKIQVGFQYLLTASFAQAVSFWKSGKLGKPIHFDLKYYHSDYLKKDYRDRRTSRLTPAPDGGAMADLGSHAISFLIALAGTDIHITGALQGGSFEDVPEGSDLFSQISLYDRSTDAVGTLTASRVSSGTGDELSFELFAEKGAIKYSSVTADYFEYFTEESGVWSKKYTGSNYNPSSAFPSVHVPGGWHRSMIQAHYMFLTGNSSGVVVPGIDHGLQVQRLVRETAVHLERFRALRQKLKLDH